MSDAPIVNGNGKTTNFPTLSSNVGASGAAGARSVTNEESKSWFEAMAKAWGNALDKQASKITDLSAQVSESGSDNPSALTELTAESLKMQFLSQSAASSNNAVGNALQTIGRKQ